MSSKPTGRAAGMRVALVLFLAGVGLLIAVCTNAPADPRLGIWQFGGGGVCVLGSLILSLWMYRNE